MDEIQADAPATDLVDAIRQIMKTSAEPMTAMMIRQRLTPPFRNLPLCELTDLLQRQVAADVLVICPKYRSPQDRYWDRPLREHAKVLLLDALTAGLLSWTELRKKLPKYLRHLAESVLNEELARGVIFRHPPASPRMGSRYALHAPDLRSYAGRELHELFTRFEANGFSRSDTRETLMQLLHEEEWAEPDLKPSAISHQLSAVADS